MEAPISVDLETAKIKLARLPLNEETEDDVPLDPLDVPVPALGMVCDSTSLYLIHPSKFDAFVQKHKWTHWVFHNATFDWWCLHKHTSSTLTREYLWQLAEEGRLHDTMICDMLLQLASGRFRRIGGSGGEQKLYPTNLGVLTEEYGVGTLNKDDPFRTRFGELIGLTETEIEHHPQFESFATYALKDVLACYAIFQKQRVKGLELMRKAGWSPDRSQKTYEMRPDCVEKWGVLSEKVQVCASLVLSELSRTPIRIDQERRMVMEAAARERHLRHLNSLLEKEPELVKKSKAKYKTVREGKGKSATKTKVLVKAAEVLYTAKAGVPQFDSKKLAAVLKAEADRLNVDPPVSKGKERRMSLSTKQWKHLKDESAFIDSWVSLENEGKMLEDLCKINAPYVYAKYDLLKVTGRTGSGHYADGRSGRLLLPSLNIQNVKRDDPKKPDESMRSLFLAPEGCLFAAVDYGYIEFRAMAAVAMALYGRSKMAEVTIDHTLNGGNDPHIVTAASVDGVPIEEFLKQDKDRIKFKRQSSKCANFGLMGGMGAATFVEYAKATGIDVTLEQSKAMKKAWKARYDEMNDYLKGSVYDGLMWETDRKSGPKLKDQQQYRLSKFLKENDGYADSEGVWVSGESDEDELTGPIEWNERERFWEVLEWAAKWKGDEQTKEDVRNRRVTYRVRRLTYHRSCTLTGRIRNHCSYTEERNHRFQALAADGAKMALFKLMRRGFKLLNFVHDEICASLDKSTAARQIKEMEKSMVSEMEQVLGHNIPVAVASEMAHCWSKA